MLDSNSLYVTDENGEEKKMTILFTFDSEDFGKQYVVFFDPESENGEMYALPTMKTATFCPSTPKKSGTWLKK